MKKRSRRVVLSQDEWILCLDLYFKNRRQKKLPGPRSEEIRQLSETLRSIQESIIGEPIDSSFRPPDGVDRRVLYFRHLDPLYPEQAGRVSASARRVWKMYKDHPGVVAMLAQAIRECIPAEEVGMVRETPPEYGYSVEEGQILTRIHIVRERDTKIIRLKKESFQDEHQGRLYCEACSFDFARSYPRHGDGFIECHHTKPLSQLRSGQQTELDDLALLCANCHRMVHYRPPWLSMNSLKEVLQR